jgi:hypothetical protein
VYVARTEMTASRILVVMLQGKRPLGRLRRWWEGNVKIYLREIGWVGMA